LEKDFKECGYMNKGMRIYLVCLVWVAALVQLYINSKIDYEKNMVQEVIATEASELSEGSVCANGHYGDAQITAEKRVMIAENIAKKLGITENYELESRTTDDGELSILTKKGEQADTKIRVISLTGGGTYLYTQIDFKGTAVSAAYEYKERLYELYADIGVTADTNLYLVSTKNGSTDEEEREALISEFLESLNAELVLKTEEMADVTLVYGYSSSIDEYVWQDGERVNVNIAITYDETEDVTYIHRGIPFVDKSF
jgi:hypothetical protein